MSKNTSASKRVIVEYEGKYYKFGTVIIQIRDGSVLYSPAGRIKVTTLDAQGIPIPGRLNNEEVDHFSFHGTGVVLVKLKGSSRSHERVEERNKIQDIGFQNLVFDQIKSISNLPEHRKVIRKDDLVVPIDSEGPLELCLNIFSGIVLVKAIEENKYQTEERPPSSLSTFQIPIGSLSGNADKILQVIFNRKRSEELISKAPRFIILPYDQKITTSSENVGVVHKMLRES